jgi:hypothetical protein
MISYTNVYDKYKMNVAISDKWKLLNNSILQIVKSAEEQDDITFIHIFYIKNTLSPAASITSWPSSAGFLLPETGASRKSPPFSLIACRKKAFQLQFICNVSLISI